MLANLVIVCIPAGIALLIGLLALGWSAVAGQSIFVRIVVTVCTAVVAWGAVSRREQIAGRIRSRRGMLRLRDAEDYKRSGAKAARLAKLSAAGFNVADGFSLTCSEITASLKRAGILSMMHGIYEDWKAMGEDAAPAALEAAMLDLIESRPPAFARLRKELESAAGPHSLWIVRSSFGGEDSLHSHAGLFESVACSRAGNIEHATARCIASYWSARATEYRRHHGIDPLPARIALLVQRRIEPSANGVTFTANPANGALNEMIIESAGAQPSRYVFDRAKQETFELSAAPDSRLEPATLKEIADTCLRIERFFGTPQDIEWGVENDDLIIFQSRPAAAFINAGTRILPAHGEFTRGPLTPLAASLLDPLKASRTLLSPYSEITGAEPDVALVSVHNGFFYLDLREIEKLAASLGRTETGNIRVNPFKLLRLIRNTPGEAAAYAAELKTKLVSYTQHSITLAEFESLLDTQSGIKLHLRAALLAGMLSDALKRMLAAWTELDPEKHITSLLYGYSVSGPIPDEDEAAILSPCHCPAPPAIKHNTGAKNNDAENIVLRELRRREPGHVVPYERILFKLTLKHARRLAALRATPRHEILDAYRAIRSLALAAAGQLVENSMLSHEDEIFFLTACEIDSGAPPSRETIERRKADYNAMRDSQPADTIYDRDVTPLRGTRVEGGIDAVCIFEGRASGTVVRPADPGENIITDEQPILLLPDTRVEWARMLPSAAGVIFESGSLLSHLATLAREYGVPALLLKPGSHLPAPGSSIELDSSNLKWTEAVTE